ncbi:hypothetical protein DO73_3982 [Burkholderia pseudomallei]|nr:hypothetical protein DO73_3982 [Burkholderia pseudomallei]
MFRNVDFPVPLPPHSACTRPAARLRRPSRNALTPLNRFATWLASSRTGVTVVSRRVTELLLIHDVLIQCERMVIIGFLTCQLLVNARTCTTPP